MGFENMRSGHSRCSNLAIALAIVSFILTYNWWSLSTQNYELMKQLDDMSEQIKLCSEEKVSCESRRNNVEQQLRETEGRVADLKMNEIKSSDYIKKLKDDVLDNANSMKKNEEDLELCRIEVNSLKNLGDSSKTMLETMKLEKETINAKLLETQETIKQLQATLKSMKLSTADPTKSNEVARQINPPDQKNVVPEPDDTQINDGPVNDADHERELDNNAKEVDDNDAKL